MKEEITNIINQVSNRTISTDEAIEDLLHLFNVSKCEDSEREAAVCDHDYVHVATVSGHDFYQCSKCGEGG